MPRRSGTDVLFRMDASGGFFCRARFVFRMLFYPSRPVPRRCSALCRVVILGLHRLPSSFVSCLRLCRVSVCALSPLLPCAAPLFRFVLRCHPRSASVAVPVCAVSPLRFASHCNPLSASCRRSGLRMAAATAEFRGRSDGDSAPAAGLLRPFPALRRFRSGRPSAFL